MAARANISAAAVLGALCWASLAVSADTACAEIDVACGALPTARTDSCMLQVSHRAEVAGAADADALLRGGDNASWHCCGGCASGQYCSPYSGSCYGRKGKHYYERCNGGAACCGGCSGRSFCSPVSGSCYDSQSKSYYLGCGADSSCCGGCAGRSFCSPVSGNCYDGKTKDYYLHCDSASSTTSTGDGISSSDVQTTSSTTKNDSAPQAASCCAGCTEFCSPISSNCYDSQSKEYYLHCNNGSGSTHDLGSGASCCHGCSGRNFCSPVSNDCYDWKAKDYYVGCVGRDTKVGVNGTVGVGEDRFTCCGGCAGSPFCSPLSQSCYGSRSKPYYMVCNEGQGFDLQACEGTGSSMRVKVLTYNLFWWNLFGQRKGNGGSAGRLISDAAQGDAFDVLGFQECDNPGWVMGDAGMMSGGYENVRWGSNAIAYRSARWELLAHGHDYTAEDRSDQYYGRRGVQWVRLREAATGRTLFFAHTHGPLPVNTGGRYGGEASAWGILGMAYRFAQRGDAVVLTGDFNAEGWSSTVRILENRIYRVMTNWVDHIFTNCESGVVETKNLGNGGSDHDALMAIIEF